MLIEMSRKGSKNMALKASWILFLLLWTTTGASAQTNGNKPTAPTATMQNEESQIPKAVKKPALQNYKDIKIGSTADEVRDKLGKAVIDDKDGFYYEFDDIELVQIRLDADKKIRLMSVTYTNKNKNAPKFEDVFGTDIAVEPNTDGKVYKRVRYPEAGYWVAYSRTAGDKPTVTVTVQKLKNK